jgi:hypothetical protein
VPKNPIALEVIHCDSSFGMTDSRNATRWIAPPKSIPTGEKRFSPNSAVSRLEAVTFGKVRQWNTVQRNAESGCSMHPAHTLSTKIDEKSRGCGECDELWFKRPTNSFRTTRANAELLILTFTIELIFDCLLLVD